MWSYPNVHGDVVATANAAGAKLGPTLSYDPFGTALGGIPDNSAGTFDYGWLGQHQRGLEHAAGIATIEMGARQYVPGMGRFLSVDPVEGGSANDYEYAGEDPANNVDSNGTLCVGIGPIHFHPCGKKKKKPLTDEQVARCLELQRTAEAILGRSHNPPALRSTTRGARLIGKRFRSVTTMGFRSRDQLVGRIDMIHQSFLFRLKCPYSCD